MHKPVLFFVLLQLFFLQIFAQNSCTNNRYIDENFSVTTLSNLQFAQAPALIPPYLSESLTFNNNLFLDLYLPDGDTFQNRPLIVIAFGGAFLVGFKTQPQIVDFCENLASRGYVTAAIDYRLGFNAANSESPVRAVYRAVQDLKASIRFLKANAATYGIDTSLVFAGGASAGGITALHAAFLDETEINNSPILAAAFGGGPFNSWPNLGCSECEGNTLNSPPDNISGKPIGVISFWGAIADLNWITANDNIPVIAFHGENDNVVNPNSGTPFNYPLFPTLHGSIAFTNHMNSLGLPNELHIFPGLGHEPWLTNTAVSDTIKVKTTAFLYHLLKPETPILTGSTTVCGGNTETYSVALHPNVSYCWEVTNGLITSPTTDGNSIDIQWNTSGIGSLTVREINDNEYESDAVSAAISIISVDVPQNLMVSNMATHTADLTWDNTSGLTYEIDYRPVGTTIWTTEMAISNQVTLPNLTPCTDYEFRVKSLCDGGIVESAFSPTATFTTACITVSIKVLLEGPYAVSSHLMETDLLQNGLLPLAQPYNRPPWNYLGTESVATLNDFPSNMVDWVLIELRPFTNSMQIAAQAAVPLLADGSAVATFPQLTQIDDYYIVVRHRNHLAVMSATPVTLPNAIVYDFTTSDSKALGTTQQTEVETDVFALYCGDFDSNGTLSVSDFNLYQTQTSLINQYVDGDGNLDRNVTVTDFNLYQPNSSLIGVIEVRY